MDKILEELINLTLVVILASGIITVLVRRYFIKSDEIEKKLNEIIEINVKIEDLKEDIHELKDVINKKFFNL